jgi:hypothetical protein
LVSGDRLEFLEERGKFVCEDYRWFLQLSFGPLLPYSQDGLNNASWVNCIDYIEKVLSGKWSKLEWITFQAVFWHCNQGSKWSSFCFPSRCSILIWW